MSLVLTHTCDIGQVLAFLLHKVRGVIWWLIENIIKLGEASLYSQSSSA